MQRIHPAVRAFITLLLLLPVSGISTPAGAQEVEGVTRLEASPTSVTVEVGSSTTLTVTARDARGRVVEAPVRIAAPRRAVQVQGDQVNGLAVGEYEIVATLVQAPGAAGEPLSVRVPVTVRWPVVRRIAIEPEVARLYEGTTVVHSARAFHADGTRRPDAEPAWESSAPDVASVDRFGHVTAKRPGSVTISARLDGVREDVTYRVVPLRARELEIVGGEAEVRTGDVQNFRAVVRDADGRVLDDVPVTWTHAYAPPENIIAPSGPAQLENGRMVADVPGVYTVIASAGAATGRTSFRAVPREVVRKLDIVGQGREQRVRTTDFWVFEGMDGRDYALTGAKMSDGYAFVWDVTDPGNIFKTDSIQVDARTINDVKVSPDGRYASLTREGASNRRNGVVILDLSTPAHPVVASEYDDGLTGGVHNAFPTDDYLFALSNGEKYVIIDVRDIYAPRYVSEYDHPDSRLHDVWVHDGIAYSAEWGTGVVAVDVGNGRWGGSIDNPVYINHIAVPDGRTHAVFPYHQESTGKFYLFIGDEIMSRAGLANEGIPGNYQVPFDPETGQGGVPLNTRGYIQVIDFTDPSDPAMVARYEVPEYGTHNIWVENDILYQAYYEGGLRVVDVSGELMGNLYTQGREIAVLKSADPRGYVPNSPMVWSAMPFKGHIFFSDTNSGLWSVKLQTNERPVME